MMPAAAVADEVLEKRRIYWHHGATTTHWPDAWEARLPRQREEEEQQAEEEAEDAPFEGYAEPAWEVRELAALPAAAPRLIGWHGMDDAFHARPPTRRELLPLYQRWAQEHAAREERARREAGGPTTAAVDVA